MKRVLENCMLIKLIGASPIQYFEFVSGLKNQMKTINRALKRDIPKKPLEEGNGMSDYYFCPICNGILSDHDLKWGEEAPNYCPNCGQAIDWRNQDER